jgi:type III restriction enzyme
MELDGFSEAPDIKAVVAKTSDLVTQQTIDIPRILVVPEGEVKTGFNSFTLDLKGLNYSTISEDLWIQYLRTSQLEVLALGKGGIKEARLEDYVVSGLIDFDDISYDDHADLLYDLAGQVARHFQTTFSDDEIRKILRCHQQQIARFVHAQMQTHYWEEAVAYKVVVSKGFSELKESAYSYQVAEPLMDYGISPEDKSNMSRYLFGGFKRCLYRVQKFDSEAERKLASILERDALKWFKPAKGQFQIIYRHGAEQLEYIPDFVAETNDRVFMLEPKASNQMEDPVVLAKKEAAVKWCANASDYAKNHGVKTWRYVLIPHNEIAVNVTLDALAARFGV